MLGSFHTVFSQIEEVLPGTTTTTEANEQTTRLTETPLATTTVRVAHRGSPKTSTAAEEEYRDDGDAATTEAVAETSTVGNSINSPPPVPAAAAPKANEGEEPEYTYEYEYYYEEYDDEEEGDSEGEASTNVVDVVAPGTTTEKETTTTTTTQSSTSTAPSENSAAFQNLLGLIHSQKQQLERPRSAGIALPGLGSNREEIPDQQRLPGLFNKVIEETYTKMK